jgi:hypothetical protein
VQLHLRDVLNGLDGRVLNKPEILIPEVNTKIDLGARELTGPTTRGLIGNQLRTFAALYPAGFSIGCRVSVPSR